MHRFRIPIITVKHSPTTPFHYLIVRHASWMDNKFIILMLYCDVQ